MTNENHTCPLGETDCPHLHRLKQLERMLAQLREEIKIDSLTGLKTHAHFMEALRGEMERTRRTGLPTTLIMMDIDHFKRVNDEYGHEAGNVVLHGIGRILKENVRALDIPCRYGGEEFAIILPATDLGQGLRLAERLRRLIKGEKFEFRERPIQVTASFGVDSYKSYDPPDIEDFIHRTDLLLLKAKQGGRDRIESPSPELLRTTDVTQDEKLALFGGDR